jgi:putative SOS response-associated peptidase YedK
MCGRYASARSVDDIASAFGIADGDVDLPAAADWNIAPTKPVPAVLLRDDRRVLTALIWGLVPAWADDPSIASKLFNARAETVAEKPAFRDALASRRCLLPADGWFEWQRRPDGARQPHYLTSATAEILAFAGLWELWRAADGRQLTTATIITAEAPDALKNLHDRAPVVVPKSSWPDWLDPNSDALAVLAQRDYRDITTWPVGPEVGDVGNNGPDLIRPVSVDEQEALF